MQPTPPRVAVVSDAASGLLTGTSIGMLSDAYTYNTFGETSEYSLTENGAVVFDEQYVRDDAGRITSRTETSAGTSTTIGYGYDTAGRLASVTRDGTQTTAYSYNANGGRSAKSMPGATYSATYDDQDRLLTYLGATYSYTANGELSTKTDMNGTTSYTYDALGNLRTVVLPDGKRVDYVIDGQNRRVGKKVNGTLVQGWLYADQLRIVAELDGTGTIVSQFVYGTHTNVPDYMLHGGNTYRFITDHVGSPRFLIDTGTNLVQSVDYDEFGTVLSDSAPGFQPFGFAGGFYDPDTRLVRFGARDYDPQTGRWTAKDPIGFGSGSANVYGYASNDPINFIDPSGLKLCRKWLPGKGWSYLDDQFAPSVDDFLTTADELGVHDLAVTSAFRSTAKQAAMRKNPAKYGAITPAKNSLHSAGWAIDVNFGDYSSDVQDDILEAASAAGLSWGGDFSKRDPVHFYTDPTGGNKKLRKKLIKQAQDDYNNGATCGCN